MKAGAAALLFQLIKNIHFLCKAGTENIYFGKNRKNGQNKSVNEKMQQLFNIDFTEENEKVSFFDSTKKEIVADEIVLLALRWSLN